jgi:hypothetical protein
MLAELDELQGIHNVFIVMPQFLVTILCAVVFAVFDSEPKSMPPPMQDHDVGLGAGRTDRPNSVVYIFRWVQFLSQHVQCMNFETFFSDWVLCGRSSHFRSVGSWDADRMYYAQPLFYRIAV